jgi:hypothetical protein
MSMVPDANEWVPAPSSLFSVFTTRVPLAVIQTPAYHFTIEGTERKATDSCEEYLALLQRMVGTFKADHP